ncbi:MAG: undecaprenyl diphosphate synthase family protein [Methanoregulaceae archaeon]|jgi:undecaprenyl diphosphate synthase|nr:undecaprenyl diphosphate synthase family protein [Methanoregulaceae archaeon]MCU0627951.1 undecaprenyl diphosphate synthase family protein [Methanoregulaceae archaeon]
MIHWLYERALLRGIEVLPAHICFMITESDMEASQSKLNDVTRWCLSVNDFIAGKNTGGDAPYPAIKGITFHISTPDPTRLDTYLSMIRKVGDHARLHLHLGENTEVAGEGMDVCVAVGNSGREEIVCCIRRMAEDGISPETTCEQTFEEYLTFPYAPDLVIKTGGSHLTDFLIWQSVYSELFFSDVNWKYFRKIDFLRALRDYQARVRRFGK